MMIYTAALLLLAGTVVAHLVALPARSPGEIALACLLGFLACLFAFAAAWIYVLETDMAAVFAGCAAGVR